MCMHTLMHTLRLDGRGSQATAAQFLTHCKMEVRVKAAVPLIVRTAANFIVQSSQDFAIMAAWGRVGAVLSGHISGEHILRVPGTGPFTGSQQCPQDPVSWSCGPGATA